jgi:hypothetical protein
MDGYNLRLGAVRRRRRREVAAVAAARELPELSLFDALELTMLIARKDSSRYPRVAARPSSALGRALFGGSGCKLMQPAASVPQRLEHFGGW